MLDDMSRWLTLVIPVLLAAAGCASSSLPYKPEQQPAGANVSAAYQVIGDRLRVEIATDGRRLEEASILRPDGSVVPAQTIEHFVSPGYAPASVGIGIGGGSFGGRGGVATGVGIGVPVGGSSGGDGPIFAHFPLQQAGSSPWRLRVKLAGVEPAIIVLGQ
jgi:hypothetical protein